MMRSLFLFLSTQKGIRKWMETSESAKKITRRFIAGETLEEEVAVCERLAAEKAFSSLDHLGENVTKLAEAAASKDSYLEALNRIADHKLPSTVSVKLTQLGLDLSPEACLDNLRQLTARAKEIGSTVEVDMESSDYTDRTLDLVMKMKAEGGSVRAVIQAYLLRSEADIKRLNELKIPVRLCKGAYSEPASVAFPSKREVDSSYVKLMKLLLDKGTYPALATHDERIAGEAFRYVRERKIAPEQFEFQMLYGINRDLERRSRRSRLSPAPLRPLWRRLVSLLHAALGRAPCQCSVRCA